MKMKISVWMHLIYIYIYNYIFSRCLVDSEFGAIKKLYQRTDCDQLSDITRVVDDSSSTNKVVEFSGDGGNLRCRMWEDQVVTRITTRVFSGYSSFTVSESTVSERK